MTGEEWRVALTTAVAGRPAAIEAETYAGKKASTNASPPLFDCSDGCSYWLKGAQAGRVAFNDHVIARLARRLGAPVPDVAIVNLTKELAEGHEDTKHVRPGPCHGSKSQTGETEQAGVRPLATPGSETRWARLAVLYGWMHAADVQFLYTVDPPAVYSVDHGHFFPNGPEWQPVHLQGAPAAAPWPSIVTDAGVSAGAVRAALERLRALTNEDIANAVAWPPDQWNAPEADRVALAIYLETRRGVLIAPLG